MNSPEDALDALDALESHEYQGIQFVGIPKAWLGCLGDGLGRKPLQEKGFKASKASKAYPQLSISSGMED